MSKLKKINELVTILENSANVEDAKLFAYDKAKDVDIFTKNILEQSNIEDPILGDNDYLSNIKAAFAFMNNTEDDHLQDTHVEPLINEPILFDVDKKLEDNDLIQSSLTNALNLINEAQQQAEDIKINERKNDISIIPLDNIDGILHVNYLVDDKIHATRSFNVKLSGQIENDIIKYDLLKFKDEYLYNVASYKLASKKPEYIDFKSNKEYTLSLVYDYISENAGKEITLDVFRVVNFVDEDGNYIKNIPLNSDFNDKHTFEGVYQENNQIAWYDHTAKKKKRINHLGGKYNFPAISGEEIDNYLRQYGYKKKGPSVGATIADANSGIAFYNSKVVCVPIDKNIDNTGSKEVVKEIHRQIIFKDIDDDSIINTFNQTSIYRFEKLNDNKIINEHYTKWEPEVDLTMDSYKRISTTNDNDTIIHYFKRINIAPKISLDVIFDTANEMYDLLPQDMTSDYYTKFATINELMNYQFSKSGYNPGFVKRVNNRYTARMLENINEFRQMLGLNPLLSATDQVNKNTISNIISNTIMRHTDNIKDDIKIFDDYVVDFENVLSKTNIIGLGFQLTPEAIADYIFKSILIESEYIFDGDVSNWSHLRNIVKTDNTLFLGTIFISDYAINSKGTEPFSDIEQHTYNLTIVDRFITKYN